MGIIQRKKAILMNEPHLVTMTGKLITFETDMVAPLEIIGSGNITVSGKNMLDPATHSGAATFTLNGITFSLNDDGSVTINGKIADPSNSSPQFTYTFTAPFSGNVYFCANSPYTGSYMEVYMYDATLSARCKQWDGVSNGLSSTSARPICEAQFVAGHTTGLNTRVNRQVVVQYDNVKISPMILAPTCTDTAFEAYKGATLPISSKRKSFKGINNIWSDSGNDITVRYWTH